MARPVDLLDVDKTAMPPQVGWSSRVRLGRDYYVRVDVSDYSVDTAVIGRLVDVHADLDHVQVAIDGRLGGEHARVWARGQIVTDPAHVSTARVLREQFQQPVPPSHDTRDGLVRDLADCGLGLVDGLAGGLMPTAKTQSTGGNEALKQIHYLAGAMKAARITESSARLGEHDSDAGWIHEEYLAAEWDREVATRNATGHGNGCEPPGSVPASPSKSSTGTPYQLCGNMSLPFYPAGS
ncbi:Mu transposase domain-containing protein [Kribbella sp. NBC_00359]|uniref:Mu transposase domain-containing protein n=1 Tax=Kribbella sp. NBC_00359 TaxID=2975966 RepID=UPI002E1A1151